MNPLVPTRIRWVLVVCITFMAAIFFVDRVNVSIAGHSIAQAYHLTDVQLGWIFSAFFMGYGLFQIPAGWLADRLGPRLTLTMGAVWWAAFTALTAGFPAGIAQGFLIIFSVRFLLGVGESVVFPSSNRWVANWIPTTERGLANGLIFAGVGAGSAFAPPILRYSLVHLGWRASFWICGVLGLAAGAAWYAMARNHPDQHSGLNDAERKLIRQGIPQRDPLEAPKLSWSAMLGSKDVWALTLSYFCFCYTPTIFFTWFFKYLTQVRGLNLNAASYYTMLPFLAMSLGSAVGGWIADIVCRHFGRGWGRCGVAAIGMVGAGLFIAAALHVSTAGAASIILAAGAGSLYLAQSAYWALSADYGKGSAGSLSGFMNMVGQAGGAVAAISTPLIAAHFGWTLSFLTAAGLCVLGAALWLVINPNRSLTSAETQP
jgi:ACS family glucarate transporter-like MFS transporter